MIAMARIGDCKDAAGRAAIFCWDDSAVVTGQSLNADHAILLR